MFDRNLKSTIEDEINRLDGLYKALGPKALRYSQIKMKLQSIHSAIKEYEKLVEDFDKPLPKQDW